MSNFIRRAHFPFALYSKSSHRFGLATYLFVIVCFTMISFGAMSQQPPGDRPISKKNLRLSEQSLKAGDEHYRAGEYAVAITAFARAIELNPGLVRVYRFMGDAQMHLKQYEQAVDSYTHALTTEKDSGVYFNRGEANRNLKRIEEALKDFEQALILAPRFYQARLLYGKCLYDLQHYRDAINEFNACIQLDPDPRAPYLLRGFALARTDAYAEAISDLDAYLQRKGKDPDVYYYKGLCYLNMDAVHTPLLGTGHQGADSAIVNSLKFDELAGPGRTYDIQAVAYANKRDSSAARRLFKLAATNAADPAEVYFLWGKAEFNFGEFAKGKYLIAQYASMVKSPSTEAIFYMGLASGMMCDTSEGLRLVTQAILQDSLTAEYCHGRVGLLFNSTRRDENVILKKDLKHLMNIERDAVRMSYLHAYVSLVDVRLGQYDDARKDIALAMKTTPSLPIHYVMRGYLGFVTRQPFAKIISDYDSAIIIDKTAWQPWMLKSWLHHDRKDFKNSCSCIERAIELGAPVSSEQKQRLCFDKDVSHEENISPDYILAGMLLDGAFPAEKLTANCKTSKK